MSPTLTQLNSALAHEEDKLLACVHCGLCLEACPTYYHTGDENDSPRGRIYLMRAVEEKRLEITSPSFERHINRCLGCRACEQACPAGVQYGQLLEAARGDLKTQGQRHSLTSRTLHFVLKHIWQHPARLRLFFNLSRLMRDFKIPSLLLATHLPQLTSPRLAFALNLLQSSAPADFTAEKKSSVNSPSTSPNQSISSRSFRSLLFTGCVMEGLFARVNRATARVLQANNCEVQTPPQQVCCGALHAHAGDLEGARALARRNIEAFATDGDASIISNAGGCGAMLCSYGQLLADDPDYRDRAEHFSLRVKDISQQLAVTGLRTGAAITDCAVTYDASCHLLYGQRATSEPVKMMGAIDSLQYVPLEGSEVCCGGAGVYNLLEPDLSGRVLNEKLHHIKETKATVLTTGNPGCHMQIAAGARAAGMEHLRVCHPVELLDEAYRRAGVYQNE